MKQSTKRFLAALTIIAVALAPIVGAVAVGPVAADYSSSPSIDTSTSDDTSTQSEVAPGDTLGDNNTFAANSSKNDTVQWIAASNDTKLWLQENDTGVTIYQDGSPTTVNWNSTDGDGHFNTTWSRDELADMEHTIGENVTLDIYIENDTTADSPENNTDQIYVEWNNETTTEAVTSQDVDDGDIVDVTEEEGIANVSLLGGEDESTVELEDRSVNGTDTDVIIVTKNSTVDDDFTKVASDADSGAKLSGLLTLQGTAVTVSTDDTSMPVPVYNEEAPDEVDEEEDTYAVQTTVGGEDALRINLGSEDFDDPDEVDVTATGGAGIRDRIGYATNAVASMIPV